MQSKKRIHNFLFFSGVCIILGSVVGMMIGAGAADQRLDWGWPVLGSSAFCFFIGVALILITRHVFVCVLEGKALVSIVSLGRDAVVKENEIFWKSDIEEFVMFNLSDIPGEIIMQFQYLEGAVFKKLKYVIKYDLSPEVDALQSFVNKFRNGIIRDRLWFDGEVMGFVNGLLFKFQNARSQNLIDGNFHNPQSVCQQSEFVKLVHADLNSKLQEAGLRLTEVRFFI